MCQKTGPASFALAALLLCSSCAREDWIPSWLAPPRKVEYREINTRRNGTAVTAIDRKDALADLGMFRYMIETSYAGYEYQEKFRKVDFDKNFGKVEKKIREMGGTKLIKTSFAELLLESLDGVSDGHLSFYANMTGYIPYAHDTWYHSGITVLKQGNKYVVETSSVRGIVPLDEYRDSENYLFRIYSETGEKYRIGAFSVFPLAEINIKFGNKKIAVPVFLDAETAVPSETVDWSLSNGVAWLRIPSFSAITDSPEIQQEGRDRLAEVEKRIRQLSEAQTVVIDLRNNKGGIPYMAALIPAVVFDRQTKNFLSEYANLLSPGVLQAEANQVWDMKNDNPAFSDARKQVQFELENQKKKPVRKWVRNITRENALKPVESKRKLILILNRYSVSAAELLCNIRSIPNVTILGENSAGVMAFVNPQLYVLPASQIPVLLPASIIFDISYSSGEGKGVLPDYWVLQNELADTLRSLTGAEVPSWLD